MSKSVLIKQMRVLILMKSAWLHSDREPERGKIKLTSGSTLELKGWQVTIGRIFSPVICISRLLRLIRRGPCAGPRTQALLQIFLIETSSASQFYYFFSRPFA